MINKPKIEVIDLAIELVRKAYKTSCLRAEKYSCVALARAAEQIHGTGDVSIYADQYQQYCQSRERWLRNPRWWNDINNYRSKPRIAALKAFRQACIDAAKK